MRTFKYITLAAIIIAPCTLILTERANGEFTIMNAIGIAYIMALYAITKYTKTGKRIIKKAYTEMIKTTNEIDNVLKKGGVKTRR